jgi:dinuclear metal center YbgI/SA1388 family protein
VDNHALVVHISVGLAEERDIAVKRAEMAGVALQDVVEYLDAYLRIADVADYENALNGLQVENSGSISRIAAAVDASAHSIGEAVRLGCDLLLVHHGMFWDGNRPVAGRRFRRLKQLLQHDIAVYAAHLPLDVHEETGNNVLLARRLGVALEGGFGEYRGTEVGRWGRLDVTREELAERLGAVLGESVRSGGVLVLPHGPTRIGTVGVVTGGGGSLIGAAREAGLDAFVTGEGAHHTYFDAEEGGINVYFGGHYGTETLGVRALGERVASRYGVGFEFIEHPTGL